MIRKLFTILAALILPVCIHASSGWLIGVEGGYSYSLVDTATGWSGTYISNGHGFEAAAIAEYRVNDYFSVTGGMRYIMKSSGYHKENSSGDVIDDYVKMHHMLEFPLTLRFSAEIGDFRLYAGAGGYLGVRLFDVHAGYSESLTFDGNGNSIYGSYYEHMGIGGSGNLFDAGILAEAGVMYHLNELGYLYGNFRYQYALTSLEKNYRLAAHTYFSNLSFDIGFMFDLQGGEE